MRREEILGGGVEMKPWAWVAAVVLGVACVGAAGGAAWLLVKGESEPTYPRGPLDGMPTPEETAADEALERRMSRELERRLPTGEKCQSVGLTRSTGHLSAELVLPTGDELMLVRVYDPSERPAVRVFGQARTPAHSERLAAFLAGRGSRLGDDDAGAYIVEFDWKGSVLERHPRTANKADWEQAREADMTRVMKVLFAIEAELSPPR
jgi:hypothetical protein